MFWYHSLKSQQCIFCCDNINSKSKTTKPRQKDASEQPIKHYFILPKNAGKVTYIAKCSFFKEIINNLQLIHKAFAYNQNKIILFHTTFNLNL